MGSARPTLPLGLLIASFACATDARDEMVGGGDGAGPDADPDTGGDGGGPDGDHGTDDDGDGGGGAKFDTPDGEGGPGDGEAGCEKVDFLFVVDNSGSMWDNQQNLANSFPGFMSTIRDTLNASDYQIMVIDTDTWLDDAGSVGSIGCNPHPDCCYGVCQPGWTCNGWACPIPPPPPTACDAELGAGRMVDVDYNQCVVQGGNRFIIDGEPDLTATFECLALVGTYGDGNERPMEAMARAVHPTMIGPGGCNEGFVRDDAILVVTFITDEEDEGKSQGDPGLWHQALVDAKGGNADAVVVLGLTSDEGLPGAVCTAEQEAPRLHQFVSMFNDRGSVGSVCAPDYTPFFLDAVSLIDIACNEFTPEG